MAAIRNLGCESEEEGLIQAPWAYKFGPAWSLVHQQVGRVVIQLLVGGLRSEDGAVVEMPGVVIMVAV